MNISIHIEYLLRTHDCVIIPGLGAILAHQVPAVFDEESQCWTPPTRIISFNPDLSRNDGLIASSVARSQSISIELATSIVKKEADDMLKALNTEHQLKIGDLGSLFIMPSNRLMFISGSASWISPSTMWLPPLPLKEVTESQISIARNIAAEAKRRRVNSRIWWSSAAAACLILTIAFAWLVMQNPNLSSHLQLASFKPTISLISDNHSDSDIFDIEFSQTPPQVILSTEPQTEADDNCSISENQSGANYLLIVASFGNENDAQKFIDQYPGEDLHTIASENRFRVYAATGNTWDEVYLISQSSSFTSKYPSSWIFANK